MTAAIPGSPIPLTPNGPDIPLPQMRNTAHTKPQMITSPTPTDFHGGMSVTGKPMPAPAGFGTPMTKPAPGPAPSDFHPGMTDTGKPTVTGPWSGLTTPTSQASATSPYAPPAASTSAGSGRVSPQSLQGFDQFADAAYEASTRRLDPQFAQMQDRFAQDMVNRGLAQGTEAYNEAWNTFSMDRNDAYSQARNQALAQALAAQGQAFGQDFQNRNLSQQARQFSDSLGFQYAGLGEQGRQFDANLGQRESEFGRNFGFQGERADMQDLMALLGFGQNATMQNNAMLNQDFNRSAGLFGLIPGMQPTQVDAMSPYQMQQNAWMQQSNQAQNASNGMWGAIGQLGQAFISDARLKTDVERVGTLDNGLPIYMARYVTGGPRMLMLMAQDVQETKPEAIGKMGEFMTVDYEKAVAA